MSVQRPTAVTFDQVTATWVLSTPAVSYAFRLVPEAGSGGADSAGTADSADTAGDVRLQHVYWGPRLQPAHLVAVPAVPDGWDDVLGEELPAEGGQRFGPAGLMVEFPDGVRALQWRYRDHHVDGGHLAVTLVDRALPLALTLHYRVWPDSDVLERWAVLRHAGDDGDPPVAVQRCDSAHWTLPVRDDYRLSHVSGGWAAEFQLHRTPLAYGETTVASRRGVPRHQANPWLMVDDGTATEEHGEVFSTVLAFSGGFRLTARRTGEDLVVLATGADWPSPFRLQPGEEWASPVCAGLHRTDGFGGTSRAWHDYLRRYVLPAADEVPPVLYNSWEGSWFDVDERNQQELAAYAAELGAEVYVVDDGWFAGRTSDRAALGDWWPDPVKFPRGLAPLVDEVHRLGMRFGIWVEPEMVNPDSDLYRAHPDWVLHQPGRRRTEIRHQLVLNLARDDVAQWVHRQIDALLAGHAIDFVKWDMNRPFTEAGWPGADDPHRLWVDHTRALYRILDRLRADHPHVRFETCGSGGGRVDAGILARTDQAWVSDDTDPVDRIAIQHGYGQVYPAVTMGAWASDSPNPLQGRETPVRFRFHVAMAGALGISGDLRRWSAPARAEAAALVADYRRVRHVVAHGDLYRVAGVGHGDLQRVTRAAGPAPDGGTAAVAYVTADRAEAVVLVWRPRARTGAPARPEPPLRLPGLDPAAEYALVGADTRWPGAVLRHHGLPPGLPAGDYASALHHLRRV